MVKLHLLPKYRGEDHGDGGIRRVVEAQYKYLSVEFVDSEAEADIVALHAGMWTETNKPVVAHCHGLYWKEFEWPNWAHKLNREVADNIRRADVVTAPSEWVANALRRAFLVDPVVLHHGVEDIGVGSSKGYVLWNKTRADSVCLETEIEELARRVSGIQFVSTFGHPSDNLEIVGRQAHVDAVSTLKGAAVYLGTTKETFGIGILEAMVAGIPVLSWNWGGQAEVIQHKITGYLVEPGNFDALEEGLRFCLEHRDQLGRQAREFVLANYLWEQRIKPYQEIYEMVERKYKPGVTVVIPCYNLGRYLHQAVKSALPYSDEIIIVDDKSTDDSLDIALELKNEKVKVISNDRNMHVSASRNRAIEASSYRYIATLDADDYLVDISSLKQALDKDRGLDIAYGAVQFVDEAGVPVEKVGPNGVSDWPPDFKYRGLQVFPYSYCPITSLYRKSIWEKVGGYRERYKGVEDADFYTRALSVGSTAKRVTDSITFVYRMRSDSLSHTQKKIDWTLWYPKQVPIPPEGTINIPSYDPVQVSVVIPVGPGHERLVLDALDSLWAQSFEKWEAIVVNDSGHDIWLPSWVRRIDCDARNPASARNLGIGIARGRYVYFLDADDWLQQNALELMLSKILQIGGFVYSDWFEAESGRIHQSVDCVCEENLRELLTAVNVMFPKSVEVRFDETLQGWEDWDFILQLAEKGLQGNRVDKPLFSYRLNSGTRREVMYTDRENLKREMYRKWGPYIRGEKKLACGACGQKPRAPMAVQAIIPAGSSGDAVLLEYTGASLGTRTFPGKATGRVYRFGNDPDHKVKYVLKEDAPYILQLKDFKRYEGSESVKQLVTS